MRKKDLLFSTHQSILVILKCELCPSIRTLCQYSTMYMYLYCKYDPQMVSQHFLIVQYCTVHRYALCNYCRKLSPFFYYFGIFEFMPYFIKYSLSPSLFLLSFRKCILNNNISSWKKISAKVNRATVTVIINKYWYVCRILRIILRYVGGNSPRSQQTYCRETHPLITKQDSKGREITRDNLLFPMY